MEKQLIITIGREFGSGGQEIANELARRFDLPLYDKTMLEQIAEEKGVDAEVLKRYDEAPRNILFTRHVKGYSNSMEENVAQMQFEYLRDKAAAGESFVVLGRCGEEILKANPNVISIFVLADIRLKRERVMRIMGVSADEALEMMSKMDRRRKCYHNQFSNGKWGDSRSYDLCVNSARLGVDKTIDFLEQYIRLRQAQM